MAKYRHCYTHRSIENLRILVERLIDDNRICLENASSLMDEESFCMKVLGYTRDVMSGYNMCNAKEVLRLIQNDMTQEDISKQIGFDMEDCLTVYAEKPLRWEGRQYNRAQCHKILGPP